MGLYETHREEKRPARILAQDVHGSCGDHAIAVPVIREVRPLHGAGVELVQARVGVVIQGLPPEPKPQLAGLVGSVALPIVVVGGRVPGRFASSIRIVIAAMVDLADGKRSITVIPEMHRERDGIRAA